MSGTARRFRPIRRLIVTADVPDDAPAAVKEGLARRRIVATTGRCPCGATWTMPDHIEPGTVIAVTVSHENDCPANDDRLAEAMRSAQ